MFYYQSKEQSSFRVVRCYFLSYVQCKPSDKSNQLHLKISQLHITECLCSWRCAFTARVPFKIPVNPQNICHFWILSIWKEKKGQKILIKFHAISVEGQGKELHHVFKLVLSLKYEQPGWRQLTESKEMGFALNVCRVPLYDNGVVYTLTKPLQMLVSFPFKKVVTREQQVWWFYFSFVSAYFIVFCCKQKNNVCCAVKNPSATTTHATVVLFVQ